MPKIAFSREQTRELEDIILNIITPVYAKLQIAEMRGKIKKTDIDIMLERLDTLATYIKSLHMRRS